MRQLILFRHAKAEAFADDLTDELRRLTERGQRDALAIAEHLARHEYTPDRVVCSVARRTRETWNAAATALPPAETTYSEELYLADPSAIVAEISRVEEAACVMIIGHNPGIHELASDIAELGGSLDPEAARRLYEHMPTAGAAVFESVDDTRFERTAFRLVAFFSPKSI